MVIMERGNVRIVFEQLKHNYYQSVNGDLTVIDNLMSRISSINHIYLSGGPSQNIFICGERTIINGVQLTIFY
jgi:hypothetical protein